MRAAQVTRFGDPEVLETRVVPPPVAGPGKVLLDVAFADTLFVETQIRSGWGGEYFKVTPPYVPGFGAAAKVSAVGENVDSAWIGKSVVARTETGSYAEQAIAAAESLVAVPEGLDLRTAAALLSDGPTAMVLAEHARITPGQWVLVVAAAGGMGVLLVQIARAAGAKVIGAARGDRKLALVRELGADLALDYSKPGWAERAREATGGNGLDLVLDGAGGEVGRAAFDVTARGGQFSAHGAPSGGFSPISPEEAAEREITLRGIQHVQLTPPEVVRFTKQALAAALDGTLRPIIGQTFPLERAAAAHAAIASRDVIGKTLLVVE